MPRILEQLAVHCGTCGEYLWKYTVSVYIIGAAVGHPDENRDDFCPRCERRKYIECIKTADKILPLTASQRDDPKNV